MIPGNATAGPNEQHDNYSDNWGGAVLIGNGFKSVIGTFTVPSISVPSGGDPNAFYSSTAWVGIDGDTCSSAILQTGVDFTIENGQVSYSAWYEWWRQNSIDFTGISFSAGDSVQLYVQAYSTTSGIATIENLSNGQKVSHQFKNEGSIGELCETNAEWIVEDYEINKQLVPLADFGTVTFTDCSASDGQYNYGVSGATLLQLSSNGQASGQEAEATIDSDSQVTVRYL
ncbi:hypothetical protein K461DRAFT_229733 [Myriangium duriaei CBS 260.36]|uniref:Peptidase A4 family protein n=1 Tax=Myriangium duriaei CBS 260.36 TaxID=1168546 RepID=A0A9P4MDN5_9PEZI|nr:hypothetical protein K461DRAFT_229733 [Myriangium duriaei CBS 260.36]